MNNNENVIRAMFEQRNRYMAGVAQVCPKCGGGSAAFCECAYQRFRQSVTPREIQEFLAKRNASAHQTCTCHGHGHNHH